MVDDREVKAKIAVELDEAAFVRLKAQLNKEFEQIKINMAKAMSAAGVPVINTETIKQFTREFVAAKNKEASAAKSSVDEQVRQLRRLEAEENRIESLRERIQEQGAGLFGGYRGMRAMRMFDTAKELSGAQGGGDGAMDAISVIAGATLPLMAFGLGIKAVTSIFEDLRQAGKDASAALFEIGGGKNLQATLVQAAKNEADAARVAGISNLSTGDVQSRMNDIKSKYGIKQEDINTMYTAYAKTSGGRLQDMPTDTIAKLSLITKQPEQVGAFAGRIKADYPNMGAGALSDLLIQANFIKNSQGVDVFSNPDLLDKLRPVGAGYAKQLALAGAVARGSGGKIGGRQTVNELLKYELAGDTTLSNLAAASVGNTNLKTAPGAIHQEALAQGFADTKKGMQDFIDHIENTNDAFRQFNDTVNKVNVTEEAQQTLLQNQIQIFKSNDLKSAQDALALSTKETAGNMAVASDAVAKLGIYFEIGLQQIQSAIGGLVNSVLHPLDQRKIALGEEAAQVLTNPNVRNGLSIDQLAEYTKQYKEGEEARRRLYGDIGTSTPTSPSNTKPSGQKDPTVGEHTKATANHTATIAEMMKANNTYLQQVNQHLSVISRMPVVAPKHNPQ